MKITKSGLNNDIVEVRDFKKRVVVNVTKDGLPLFDLRFNSITNYAGNVAFEYDCITTLSLYQNSILIKHKLKYDFQSDKAKFYTLEI